MKNLAERGLVAQLSAILGLVALVVSLFGGIVLYAADSKIDEKYATDADVLAVQETVSAQVTRIETTVTENTRTVAATPNSVDGLTLVVLGLQLSDLEEEIAALEKEKRAEGAGWNERDERNLRDRQRALSDLERQRSALLDRIMAGGDDDP